MSDRCSGEGTKSTTLLDYVYIPTVLARRKVCMTFQDKPGVDGMQLVSRELDGLALFPCGFTSFK